MNFAFSEEQEQLRGERRHVVHGVVDEVDRTRAKVRPAAADAGTTPACGAGQPKVRMKKVGTHAKFA